MSADFDQTEKKKKANRPGRWKPLDILIGLLALGAIAALTAASFLAVKWVIATYF